MSVDAGGGRGQAAEGQEKMIETYQCPECSRDFTWDDSRSDTRYPCPHCGAEFTPPTPAFPAGSIIGDYELIERIGLGGMGEVYRARQLSMGGRVVALKVLQGEFAEDDNYLQRFYREVRTLAQIEHPNVVQAIEVGFDGQTHYFSMSYVPGKDLKHRLDASEKFSEHEALRIVQCVAEALRYTWERHRLLHRDIKPANIIVTTEGDVNLMDLGISKYVARKDVELTVAGMMVGSPLYVSPEQAKAEKDVDFRVDMYSLGATLYHLLAGRPPYQNENAMAIIACHLGEPVPDARAARPELSQSSCRIYRRMMMKRKEERYPAWEAAIADIEVAMAELSGEVAPAPVKEEAPALPPPPPAERLPPPGSRYQPAKAANSPSSAQLRVWRIAALLVVLLACVFAFHRMLRRGIRENEIRQLTERYQQVSTDLLEFLRDPGRERFNRTYLGLTQIKNEAKLLDVDLLSRQVDMDLQTLKERALEVIRERREQLRREELSRLKSLSADLEEDGRFFEAIQVWQEYRGDFRAELRDEIRRQIAYLEHLLRQREAGLD